LQVLAHQHPRPVQLPLRRAARDLEHHGDLAMLVAFDVVQHEDLASPRRQSLERVFEVDRQIGAGRRDGHEIERRRVVGDPLALNRKRPRYNASPFLTGLIWRWFALRKLISGKSPLITKETARNAQSKSIYQADKILKALPGFAYTPIETTIQRMATAFLQAHSS
jgi:hypothetical protein